MDLNRLVTNLRTQATANSTIVLDGTVFSTSVLDDIRTAFVLAHDANLTIAGVKPTDIPTPDAGGVLEIKVGTTSVLNQNDVNIDLTFTEHDGTIQAIIVATMSASWKFSDSFTDLDLFPFHILKTSNARFVFATEEKQSYVWAGDLSDTINLKQGLNFLSHAMFSNFPVIGSLLDTVLDKISFKFYGPFTPTAGQQLPVGTLRAPLGAGVFSVGVAPNALSLNNPAVAVRIGIVTDDNPVQQVDMVIEADFQNTLEVAVGVPIDGTTLDITTTPLPNQSSINSLIKSLPGGQNFANYIPNELSSIFVNVGLDAFSMVVAPTPEVTYLSLSIGTLQPWNVISDVLVLENLALQIQTVEPTGINWTRVYINATAKFLPNIFSGEFAFTVDLQKQTSWEVSTVSGAYYGSVTLGKIVGELLGSQSSVPSVLNDIKFSDFGVNATRDASGSPFSYSLYGSVEAAFPILDRQLTSHLSLTVAESEAGHTINLNGGIIIGDEVFKISLDLGTPDSKLTARWTSNGQPLGFGDIASAFGWDSMPSLPEDMDLGLTDAEFTYDFTEGTVALSAHSVHYGQILFASLLTPDNSPNPKQRVYLFSLDVPLNLQLSALPLVGNKLPQEAQLGIDDLQIIIASAALAANDMTALNALITDTLGDTPLIPASLDEGLTFAAKLQVGSGSESIIVPLSDNDTTDTNQPELDATGTSAITLNAPAPSAMTEQANAPDYQSGVNWLNLQKTFGPVYFDKVGVQYQDATLSFLINAALSASGLTLSLEGLTVGSPLNRFSPQFNLHGIGIDYQNDAVEIGGAFLRTQVKKTDGTEYDEYDGTVIMKTEQFSLSAIGSYAELNGHPSLFVYAVLNYPIGGPAFFFVTGLAAGFGYNRLLIIPAIEDVAQFPLVSEAVTHAGGQINLETELTKLQQYIPPSIGDVFLAVGIKFTSFKMIDSFALLTFSFGSRFEMNLLGLSTLIVPTPVEGNSATPLAEAQMAVKATFIPDEGFLGVSAQLTSASYVLSRDCHLTGGYAFYSWFSGEHEGDFVQTLGGYHPSFNVPAHYPKVPRLGFNWRIDDHISIKGGMYYALTTSAFMAGGFLQAVWEDGDLSAWFNIGADFLISWKPYHYDARVYVDMGVSYTFNFFGRHTISVDIGADLHIWGPEFAGNAHIHLWIVSFDVSFGGSTPALQPIDWQTFRASFLPQDKDICGITVKDGLVKGSKDKNDMGVINPKHLSLVTNSVIPSNSVHIAHDYTPNELGPIGQISIGSMAVAADNLKSVHTITITRDGVNAESDFAFTPVKKNAPAGLWGKELKPDLNGQAIIEQALTGFEVRPNKPPTPGETAAIDRRNLQYADPKIINKAFNLETINAFTPQTLDEQQRRQNIKNSIANDATINARKELLQSLGVNAEIDLSDAVSDEFLIAPMIEA